MEDLLDHRTRRRGSASGLEYLVKWKGYSVFEATWEPASNLTNCSEVLSAYRQRRGLRCAQGGVVLALCMTSLITLLCMRCAAHLRVACVLNFMYTEFLHYWV